MWSTALLSSSPATEAREKYYRLSSTLLDYSRIHCHKIRVPRGSLEYRKMLFVPSRRTIWNILKMLWDRTFGIGTIWGNGMFRIFLIFLWELTKNLQFVIFSQNYAMMH
jgi:hypothetical protein